MVREVGEGVANLLVPPAEETLATFRTIARVLQNQGRGLLVPLYALPGTGKTTLASSLRTWIPEAYGISLTISGGAEVVIEELKLAIRRALASARVPAEDKKIIVVNIDDREGNPPSRIEHAQIKSFLRSADLGHRCLILWPETDLKTAEQIAEDIVRIGGSSARISLPVSVSGPDRSTWADVSINTLQQVNDIAGIESLGVDPRDLDPREFDTIGDFLTKVADSLDILVEKFLKENTKKITLIVAFASESATPGVLSQAIATGGDGRVDPHKLLSMTPSSRVAVWWMKHRSRLTEAVLRLDARAVEISPSVSVPILRRFGDDDIRRVLQGDNLTHKKPSMSDVEQFFERSDFGKLIEGKSFSSEFRGNPGNNPDKFRALADSEAFVRGKDKKLNRYFANFLKQSEPGDDLRDVFPERPVPGFKLQPDLTLEYDDSYTCIELHWRKGEFLENSNRAAVAEYILTKLRNYMVDLGYMDDQ